MQKAREIKCTLYGEIHRHGWGPHHYLPSERALAERFGANPVTVRKAIREMVLAGAIYQVERVGRFVSPEVRMGQVLLVGLLAERVLPGLRQRDPEPEGAHAAGAGG